MNVTQISRNRSNGALGGAVRAVAASVLCISMVQAPLFGDALPSPAPFPFRSAKVEMKGEQRVLHALNRFTFGPRPGEVAEVQRIGLKRWFEMQLNPGTIDDSALEARLAAFPAMALPQSELMRRYPSAQMIRAMIQRNEPLPTDPVEHAIYADGIASYEEAQARKAAGEAVPAKSTPGKDDAGSDSGMSPEAPTVKGGQRAGRVDLLGADSGYTMVGGKKKSAATPADAEKAAMSSGDKSQDAMAETPPNRGHAEHKEVLFPEATTREILALQPQARVRRILALEPAQLVNFRRSLSQAELVSLAQDLTPQQREIFAALQGSARMIGAEVLQSRLFRDVYSNRQLEAVMMDFWLNHFNVYLRKNQNEPYLLPAYERETIRPHALGHFEDLLVATAISPAMLVYLDNWQSVGPESIAARRGQRPGALGSNPQGKQAVKERGLNENYARELMELHTVGVGCEVSKDHAAAQLDPSCGKGYTQADVREVAKVFSGWTIDRPNQGAAYSFEERRHEPGAKSVLGQTIHESGEKEGREVLHMLATSPATARFLSAKLAVRFVSDAPPPALVDRMARAYLSSAGDIRVVLRTMFDSPELWAPEVNRDKVKTPLEFVASALRATDADVTNGVPLVQALDRLGMPLYGMQTPNGYSWKSDTWVSTGALVARLNFALVVSGDRLAGTRANWPLLLGRPDPVSAQPVALSPGQPRPASPAASEEARLEQVLLGTAVSERTRQAVLAQSLDVSVPQRAARDFLDTGAIPAQAARAATPERQAAIMTGLLLGSPEFQRR